MNGNIKARLFGLAGLLIFGGMFAYNWYTLVNEGRFYLKIAGVTPMLMLMSLLVIAVPRAIGSFAMLDKKLKAAVLVTLVAGGLLGGVNYYAMDHYYAPVAKKPLDTVPPMKPMDVPRPATSQQRADSNSNARKQEAKRGQRQ